jgi:hypothetical protein
LLKGPPYALAEVVFAEDDFADCFVSPGDDAPVPPEDDAAIIH